MKIVAIILLSLKLTFSVSAQSAAKQISQNQSLVISFKNAHQIDNIFYYTRTSWQKNNNLITVFNGDMKAYISFEPNKVKNKIKIEVKEKYVIIRHLVNYLDTNDYLFEKGDSISIEYRNGRPFVSVSNRMAKKQDYNVEDIIRSKFKSNKYSPLARYLRAIEVNGQRLLSNPVALNKSRTSTLEQRSIERERQISVLKNELYNSVKQYLHISNTIIDSLNNIDQISYKNYIFYKIKFNYLSTLIDLETNKLSASEVKSILLEKEKEVSDLPQIFHQALVDAVADKFIMPEVKSLDLKDGTNKDYREAYDKMKNSDIFPDTDKNYLLTKEVNRIGQTFSTEDFLYYFKKYEKDVSNIELINSVRDNYKLEFDINRVATESLILSDSRNNRFTLDNIVNKFKGKIIYLDFWASWCAPCRMAFPHSVKLRSELKNKDIVFVYLSIDKTIKPWQVAIENEKLDSYSENYLIVNYQTSNFIKQQKLDAIPRYMIFDKQGKLIFANAPKVQSENLREILIDLVDK